ncbi:MAG: hypothetical protein ACRDOI_26990 [Trebonia sp.]
MTELQWKPAVFLPASLTVRFGSAVLEADDPARWCQQTATEKLGLNAGRKQVRALAQCLEGYAGYLRSKDLPAVAALFFYPDFTRVPPRAFAEVYLVGPDPEKGPLTLAMAREMYEPDDRSTGDAEITETAVPVGPALRVHRFRKADPDKRRTRVIEEVAWIICPSASTQAVMMFTNWGEPMFSKAGITIADDMAQNFRIEPIVSPCALSRVGDRQDRTARPPTSSDRPSRDNLQAVDQRRQLPHRRHGRDRDRLSVAKLARTQRDRAAVPRSPWPSRSEERARGGSARHYPALVRVSPPRETRTRSDCPAFALDSCL